MAYTFHTQTMCASVAGILEEQVIALDSTGLLVEEGPASPRTEYAGLREADADVDVESGGGPIGGLGSSGSSGASELPRANDVQYNMMKVSSEGVNEEERAQQRLEILLQQCREIVDTEKFKAQPGRTPGCVQVPVRHLTATQFGVKASDGTQMQ